MLRMGRAILLLPSEPTWYLWGDNTFSVIISFGKLIPINISE
jgi:hypothetical protein